MTVTAQEIGPLLITIDGPAGAGKTTVSRALAERLGYRYIDTGALYRGVACEIIAREIDPNDDAALSELLDGVDLQFVRTDRGVRLHSNGNDITDMIRAPRITMLASAASARPVVRQALLGLQRRLGAEKSAVFEGRDMGTVVFPEADVKFFLTADLTIRAKRRYDELKEENPQNAEEVLNDMQRRDADDSSRAVAPMRPADDAVMIDSTSLGIDVVIETMIEHIKQVFRSNV